MTKKRYLYWGGFCDGILGHGTFMPFAGQQIRGLTAPTIYPTKKEAKKVYQDVRRIEIVEVKKSKQV